MIELEFRSMAPKDWAAVEEIYREGIATGQATFEPAPPASWADFDAGRREDLRLVALDRSGDVLGWAAASPVSTRSVYRGVVEHSIYIHPEASGHRVGTRLLAAFTHLADSVGVWTIESSIFPENTVSLRLHESAGFRVVGRRERIAEMTYGPHGGSWRDTVLIERRAEK